MFKKILLASDGSDFALKATEAAAVIAAKFQADLEIVHVYTLPRELVAGGDRQFIYYIDPDTLLQAVKEANDSVARRTTAILDAAKVPYVIRHEEGHPGQVITRIAEEEHFDLIVLGSQGLSGIKAFLIGSVSDRVLHHAHCPVLIVR